MSTAEDLLVLCNCLDTAKLVKGFLIPLATVVFCSSSVVCTCVSGREKIKMGGED